MDIHFRLAIEFFPKYDDVCWTKDICQTKPLSDTSGSTYVQGEQGTRHAEIQHG